MKEVSAAEPVSKKLRLDGPVKDNAHDEEVEKEDNNNDSPSDATTAPTVEDEGMKTDDNKQQEEPKEIPRFALPACVTRFMDKDVSDIKTNHDYYEAFMAVESIRAMWHQVSKSVETSYTSLGTSTFGNPESSTAVRGCKLVESLQEQLETLETKLEEALKVLGGQQEEGEGRRPIVEKLLDSLEATPLERKIFRHVLVRATGVISTKRNSSPSPQFNIASCREMFANVNDGAATIPQLMSMVENESSKLGQGTVVRETNVTDI